MSAATSRASSVTARARSSARILLGTPRVEVADGAGGGDGRTGGLCSLVLPRVGQPRAVEGLRFVVGGEKSEADRHTGRHRDGGESVRRGLADVVEVWRLAPDDDAECDDRVRAGPSGCGRGHRKLERAGYPERSEERRVGNGWSV